MRPRLRPYKFISWSARCSLLLLVSWLPSSRAAAQHVDAALPPPAAAAAADAGVAPVADTGVTPGDAGLAPNDDAALLATPVLVPPSPRTPIEPKHPVGVGPQSQPITVGLRVSVGADGSVTAVEVTESAGPDFDQAARELVQRTLFSPATRDGQPIPARIPLRLVFNAEPEPPPAAPPAVVPLAAVPVAAAENAVTAPPTPGAAPMPVEVKVQGKLSAQDQLRKSSEAVTVVDLREAKKRSADLGEVLARVAGVAIRRHGGLGSEFRLSLNGLYDAQIRMFVDGVPVDRVYAVGLVNVPVNLIQNVEVYRGVVPLRLGADALGGAVNLVTSAKYETALQASYQVGSFNTNRVTLTGRYRHDPSGFVAGVDGFFDYADNDYKIDVEVPDAQGRLSPATVRRFHDGYWAYGAALEAGVVDKSWAKRLMLRAFTSEYKKELQNNIVMTVPYGEPHYGETVRGGLLTYQNMLARRYDLEIVGSYTHRTIGFVDKGKWVYDWFGERIRERRVPGEIEARPHDQTIWQHGAFGRALFDARVAPGHVLTATLSPDFVTRTGDEAIQVDSEARDPLSAERKAFKLVSGVAYTLRAAPMRRAPMRGEDRRPEHYRLENVLFAKSFVYRVNSEDPLPGNIFRKKDQKQNKFGAGDTARVTLVDDYLLLKTSYEYAARLPETDEIFGNGVLVHANLELKPERGHNANLGPQLDLRDTKAGDFWVDVNVFFRDSRDLIVLLGSDRFYTYQNVYRARSIGVENMVKWESPRWRHKDKLVLDGQFTYMDQRNVSSEGTFGDFKGDRIPNRPWLFASWGGFLHFESVITKKDRVEPFYQGRFVGEFFRGWESVGLREFKQTVPEQVSHAVGVTYAIDIGPSTLYFNFDVQNLTDARLYDSFGVQRPGRGYYLKLVGEL